MRPRLPALALLLLFLAGCGGGSKAAATTSRAATTTAAAAPARIRVTLTGENHHPKVNGRWSYSVRVTNTAGRPVAARIHVQILFGGVPVGQIDVHRVRNGVWKETFGVPGNPPFPPASRGQHLVLQAVVTARGQRVKRNWPIVPR
jgi:hypothetical protein